MGNRQDQITADVKHAVFADENTTFRQDHLGVPFGTAELLRAIAEKAGVHIYYKNSNVFGWMNRNYVGLHNTHSPQVIPLDAGKSTVIEEAFSGEVIHPENGRFKILLKPDETKLFELKL